MPESAAPPTRGHVRHADGPPAWRPVVGPLIAIALLVAAAVGAAVWLSILDERRQEQERLTLQAHQAALHIRARLVETEQLLLLEGSAYAGSAERFRRDMAELLQVNPALLRVELRARDTTTIVAIDAPPPRPELGDAQRARLPPETATAFETAARLNRLTYSRPYYVRMGPTGFELMDLVVPTGEVDGPLIVATYSTQRVLDHFLPAEASRSHLFSLLEADGTYTARQSALDRDRSGQFAISPLARTGTTLQVRVDALQGAPRLIPNLITALAAAMAVGLGVAMFLLVRDIRERARVERALREQVQFRRAVEDAILHALVVFDVDSRVVQVNAAMCGITGYPRDALIGRAQPMPFATPDSIRDYQAYLDRIARAAEQDGTGDAQRARGFETTYQRRDGSVFPVLVVESPVNDPDGRLLGRVLIGVDLSEQKRMEELARRQQEELQQRSRLATLGEIASTLSHELNQPLAAITSYATASDNLLGASPARPDALRQALRGIKSQAERAGQVIRSVQAFLRRRAVDRGEVDLSALIRGLEPLLRLQATRSGARVVVDVPAGTSVHADRVMLEQVLLNLTRNGFEAMADTPAGERILEISARPAEDDERGARIEVTVADRGRGVPPEALPQLFSAFFTTKREGMGLGLSLCRSVIEHHGGQLRYHPRAQGGSAFAFDLPRDGEATPETRSRAPARAVR